MMDRYMAANPSSKTQHNKKVNTHIILGNDQQKSFWKLNFKTEPSGPPVRFHHLTE